MNKLYWDRYYSKKLGSQEPSSFAQYVHTLIHKGHSILELGCGNGRDSLYFANCGNQVYALDQSQIVIDQIKGKNINPKFICKNINNLQDNFTFEINHCYARFFLHALNEEEEDYAIKSIAKILPLNGIFFSESRSVKSNLYGIGNAITKDTYRTDHKRRFIRKNDLINKLESYGFTVDVVIESKGLAIYKDDDPVVIRIHARKTSEIS